MGGKKQKSKARLDKFYWLAKEHGFRSRAAFKLIQLDKKYDFLRNANCLIDLCAAPGGWLQVAAKFMPLSSLKIGIDLDPIKPIKGAITFQADITSEKCRYLIKKEIKHFKADIVLNDGAPNVGGTWAKDAYNQSELVLFALKLATEFLKEKGIFITKVFRSSDYNSLMYVLKQLFDKVDATKPAASRNESAEIFVVCQGYKAPSYIDPKLLDPKYALIQMENEEDMKLNSINSIRAMFESKKSRGGYYTSSLYNQKSLKEFIECANPYQFLFENNKIKVITEECSKYKSLVKTSEDIEIYLEDLKVLGKKEIRDLIIWRQKIRSKAFKDKKAAKVEGEAEDETPYEEVKLNEIDQEIEALEKERKKKVARDEKKKEKNELKQKMSFINQNEGAADDGVEFDQSLFDHLRGQNIDIETLSEMKEKKKKKAPVAVPDEEIDLSEMSEEDYYKMMNDEIEDNIDMFNDERKQAASNKKITNKMNRKIKKQERLEQKMKEELEQTIKKEKEEDGEDEDEKKNDEDEDSDFLGDDEDESDDDIDDEDDFDDNPLRNLSSKSKKKLEKTNEKDSKEETDKKDSIKINEEEAESDDTDEEIEKSKKRKKLNEENDFEEKLNDSPESEDYDTDDKAEIRAIAKKMLRKKNRLNIFFKSYNRYAFDDLDQAPKWFVDEENEHNKPMKPVTKEEIAREKEELREVNSKMPKKILEAKNRKKRKIAKQMQKLKKKAENIVNQDEINEKSKIQQIEKLYRKEMSKFKEKKKYIVSKKFQKDMKNKKRGGKNVKVVDRRMKKEVRAQKRRDKNSKKSGKGKRKR